MITRGGSVRGGSTKNVIIRRRREGEIEKKSQYRIFLIKSSIIISDAVDWSISGFLVKLCFTVSFSVILCPLNTWNYVH